jgi:hypothetical protein
MTNFFLAKLVSLCLCVLAVQPVQADIAPDPISGGVNPITGKNTKIELVSEIVDIYVHKNGFRTRAEFHIHNSGPEITTDIGFPFYPFDYDHIEQLKQFVANVDGNPVTIKTGFSPTADTNNLMGPPSYKWKYWSVHLAAGQNATITVSYENDMPKTNESSSSLEHQLLKEITPEDSRNANAYQDLIEPNAYQVDYQLATGSLWKGPIGDCKIILHTDELGREKLRSVLPLPETVDKNTVEWHWTNLKPRLDLRFYLFDKGSETEQIQKFKKAIIKSPSDPRLVACLGMLYWLQGNASEELELFKEYLLKNPSYISPPKTNAVHLRA